MTRRRAWLLFETMVSLTLLVLAASALASAIDQSSRALERARLRAVALDIARSAVSLIEAGVAEPVSLAGPVDGREVSSERTGQEPASGGWYLAVDTEPTAVPGLTLLEVQAVEAVEGLPHEGGLGGTLRTWLELGERGRRDSYGDADELFDEAARREVW